MDVGRPKHSEWSRLGFEAKTEYESGKKVNVAYCLQCEKCLKNTAARRLKSHRNVCKLDINKLKNCVSECVDNDDIQSDHVNLNEESEKHHGVKRKASTRLSDIDMNVINNSTENANEDKIEKNSNKPIRRIDKNKMATFFDQMNDQERKKIDEALIELFIVFDIQFDQVNSRYFKNFIQLLRPAYGLLLPARQKLSGELLSQVYEKHINNKTMVSSGILLINKGDQRFSVTFDKSEQLMYVKTQDSTSETIDVFVKNSIKMAEEKYGTNVYIVIIDSKEARVCFTENENYHLLTCLSIELQSLVESLINLEFLNEVDTVLKEFSVPALQDQFHTENGMSIIQLEIDDFKTYYNGFLSCSKNLKTMRKLVGNETYSFNPSILFLIFNNDFEKKLDDALEILKLVHKIAQDQGLHYTLADAVEDWHILLNATAINECQKVRILELSKSIFEPISLTANYLHPRYQGKCFSKNDGLTNKMLQFILEHLNEDGMESFFQYQEKTGIFQKLFLKQYESAEIFWRIAATQNQSLSKFALQMLKIPAFTINKNISLITRCSENSSQQSKITELYHLLKMNE